MMQYMTSQYSSLYTAYLILGSVPALVDNIHQADEKILQPTVPMASPRTTQLNSSIATAMSASMKSKPVIPAINNSADSPCVPAVTDIPTILQTSSPFQASYLCSFGQSARIPSTVVQNQMAQNLFTEYQFAQNQVTQNQLVQNQLLQYQLAQDHFTSNQYVTSNQLVYNDVTPNHLCQNPLGQNQLTQSYLTQIQLPKHFSVSYHRIHLLKVTCLSHSYHRIQLTQIHLPQPQVSQNQFNQSHLPQLQRLQNQLASTVTSEQPFDHSTLQGSVSPRVPTTAVTSFPAAILQPVPVPPLIPLPQQEQDESQQLQHDTLQSLLAQENVAGTVAPLDFSAKRKTTEPISTVEHKKSQKNDHLGTVAQIPTRSVRPVAFLSSPTTSYSTTGSLAQASVNIIQALTIASRKEPSTQTEYTGIWQKVKKEIAECMQKGKSKPLLHMIKHEAQKLLSDPGASVQKAASRAKYTVIQKEDKIAYSCVRCGNVYKRKRMLDRHCKGKHKGNIFMTNQEGDILKHLCWLCGNTYQSKRSLELHWKYKHNEELPNPQSVADVASNILNLIRNSCNISYPKRSNKNRDAGIPGKNGTFTRSVANQSSTSFYDQPFDKQDGVLDLSKTSNPELISQRNSVPEQEQPIDFSHTAYGSGSPRPFSTKLSKCEEVK